MEFRQREEDAEWCTNYFLVQQGTDRVIAQVEGPTTMQICYSVGTCQGGPTQFFISLEGAKRACLAAAMKIIDGEKRDSSERRKMRHMSRKA